MRKTLLTMVVLLGSAASAKAQVSVSVGLPGFSLGVNVPTYPELIQVPGHPVYYDPGAASNYFFYDGLYWVFHAENWYASSWYDGPWQMVGPGNVPVYVLRIPVRYYRRPPNNFHGWNGDAPPRWGQHWGREWERRHGGWDRWDRTSTPPPAPLPVYQRQYAGERYPRAVEQQQEIRSEKYRYEPKEAVTRTHYDARPAHQQPQEARPPKKQHEQKGTKPQQKYQELR